MPNHTHLHLLSSLVDDSKDADMESMVGLMQSSAENIVRLLQMSNGNNILFDPHAITETARQTVDFVAEIAESTLSHLFPIYKIITYVVVALVIITIIIIVIWLIRFNMKRKERKVGKRAVRHLSEILKSTDSEPTNTNETEL
jgi:hypothetical protein